jgi:hypothetical protein
VVGLPIVEVDLEVLEVEAPVDAAAVVEGVLGDAWLGEVPLVGALRLAE